MHAEKGFAVSVMPGIKNLAKDTAIYGLSSIIGRLFNWFLVPLYTNMFAVEEYGVVTLVYAVVAFAMVFLTYGMETGFFRFTNHERWNDPMQVYSTCLISLALSSAAFVVLVLLFLNPISSLMECAAHPSYIAIMAVCVALDAFMAIPYSYLRYRSRPFRFACLRLVSIGLNIGFNLFFILLCPYLMETVPATVSWFYRPDFGIGYIFLANLIASAVNLIMFIPELRGFRWTFCSKLWKEIIRYSAPLLVLGVAGTMNQTIDKILYPYLVSDPSEAMYGLGIYGANYKLGIILLVFLQAFRFAYEPFIFAHSKDRKEDKMAAYRDSMTYFIAFSLFIFLGVMFFLDYIRYFINPRYFVGLKVVPLIMLGELFFGIFYNLSVWYKLTDRTQWGAYFSIFGLAVTLVLNIVLVPHIGYMGCAVAVIASSGLMMLASYFIGARKYVAYPVGKILGFFAFAAMLYAAGLWLLPLAALPSLVNSAVRLLLLALFVMFFCRCMRIRFSTLVSPLRRFIRR